MQLLEGFVVREETTPDREEANVDPYSRATRRDIKDQYMFGDNILVAPVFAGQTSREVILPEGKWYDFYSGEYAGEKEIITVEARLDEIPLFVRDGGIIPMIPPALHAPKSSTVTVMEVRHYGKSDGEFLLYDDDGETFDYEKGDYSWTRLYVEQSPEGRYQGSAVTEEGTVFNYKDISWKFMTE
jgi:alpha-D-xyloside xylohydrolase